MTFVSAYKQRGTPQDSCPSSLLSQRVDLSLKSSMPWLVLAGSGGMADFLSDVVKNVSSAPVVPSTCEGDGEAGPSVDLKDRVAERVRKYFPSEAETDKLVEHVSATPLVTPTCVFCCCCCFCLLSCSKHKGSAGRIPEVGQIWLMAQILHTFLHLEHQAFILPTVIFVAAFFFFLNLVGVCIF